ncbi:EAL domain-containing protein [Rhizobiales bacterium]|uniref:bifunctional diguanylate cyclase/phosphodiesterase n=1 Tax=Hongsoonwoonella zoysiae TaxID=2821844 RepID=UPI0015610513|nr:EAL domain-containing protein [Hongsoonwoonella zoysiae]NRG17950.1 EAL domain-containing protein [Hongsoonwoonella zoysiae]
MYRLISCLSEEHVTWLLGVAVVISVLSSMAIFGLMDRSQRAGRLEYLWIGAAAFTAGAGIWATHFIGMLAYEPAGGSFVSYDPFLTFLSLAAAVVLAFPALVLMKARESYARAAASAGLVVAAISIMHFVGMTGVHVPGRFTYDHSYLALAIAAGSLFALGSAFVFKRFGGCVRGLVAAGGLFALSINALHFMAMTAATVLPDPSVTLKGVLLENDVLATGIAGVMLAVISIAACAVVADERLRAAQDEAARMNALADAVVEGIAVLSNWKILDANASLAAMSGLGRGELVGRPFEDILQVDFDLVMPDAGEPSGPFGGSLVTRKGRNLPVEVYLKRVSFRDGERTIVAVRDLSERAKAEARINYLAHHDPLTGLRNLTSLRQDLPLAVRRAGSAESAGKLGIFYLDLDRFKEINDAYGHPTGDRLLCALAERMKRLTNESAYRHGGDEFVVVRKDAGGPQDIACFAARLIEELSRPYYLDGRPMTVGVSIGISILDDDSSSADDLLRNADVALYRAKSEGRSTYRIFDRHMGDAVKARQEIERELDRALDKVEFELAYQPQLDMASGEIRGFETLLRWRSRKLGNVPLSAFIPVAEESGAIEAIGAWVIRAACRDAVSWDEPLIVSVNLSAVQFRLGNLVEVVRAALEDTNIDPARLELEVTESILLHDRENAARILNDLHALGVRIAMDDFGTGYSSLSYLQAYPFDILKIDRSFVSRIGSGDQSNTIVETIIGLAAALGLTVVAEGVETDEQAQFLKERGCEIIQGYLVGEPLPIHAYGEIVRNRFLREPARLTRGMGA